MRVQLIGGPPEHEIPAPWPDDLSPSPFMCSGDNEPFQHYIRLDPSLPLFVHTGPCSGADHGGAYPREHFGDREQ